MTTERAMGEPFFGTGKPPEGYKPGDYVEYLSHYKNAWCHILYEPDWSADYQYRLPADHPFYMPPVWCLDKAAQDAGWKDWAQAFDSDMAGHLRVWESIIAHARTLQHGCEPMQEPVDPLFKVLCELDYGSRYAEELTDELRARFDITPKGEAK